MGSNSPVEAVSCRLSPAVETQGRRVRARRGAACGTKTVFFSVCCQDKLVLNP